MPNALSRARSRHAAFSLSLAGLLVLSACSVGSPARTAAPSVSPGPSTSAGPSGGVDPTASPSSAPDASPSPAPSGDVGEIAHPTDPAAVVLSMEMCCGFMPVVWNLTDAPSFILYGDNRLIFRPSPDLDQQIGPGGTRPAFVVARMNAEQVDALLRFALGPGGLLDARESYENMLVADAPTTTFTIDAAGVTKTVRAYALGMETQGPDAAIMGRLADLSDLLDSFEEQVAAGQVVSSEAYRPESYRGWLTEAFGDGPITEWPWEDLDPADFQAPPETFGHLAALSPEQVALITDEPTGGIMGMVLEADDGTLHSLSVRPLLPGEELLPPAPEEPAG